MSSLRDLTIDLLGGAVAGFYRDDEGKLYVISKSGEPGPAERFYFAHEYDHALQDQNSTIFKDQDDVVRPGRPPARPPGDLRGRRDAC